MNLPRIITLTTDFGLGHYVGQLKGVISGRCPRATVIDLTHDIEPQNITQAAWVLMTSVEYFPPGTIHVVVVDPGVGTDRRALAVKTPGGILMGPDNGVLWPAMSRGGNWLAREITTAFGPDTSRTFHGRDLFAPAAARLADGGDPTGLGPPVLNPVRLELPTPRRREDRLVGQVLFADRFGNLVTNLDRVIVAALLAGRPAAVHLADGRTVPLVGAYAEVAAGTLCALFGSAGYLEIAVSGGDARRGLDLAPGDRPEVGIGPAPGEGGR
ncbi:MAG: SAM-dependent chlorinase/fluorinase [Proteobacteria bacterium]|nr:SAM-dependent chlorinase/fluorinase [Pseudomonadota bacterium]MBU1741863.1 SAM-dependent chlorinase/fluorinase [Pseudomonadota bacterium]